MPRVKRQLMAEQWEEFSGKVLPLDAPSIQRTEMRRAFYAGANSILFRVLRELAPEREPTEADVQVMQDLEDEMLAFGKAVQAGEA